MTIDYMKLSPELPGDSNNYEVITEAVHAIKDIPGLACEIGLRRGGGSKFIIDAMVETEQKRPLIAIDPYGNIDYVTQVYLNHEPQVTKLDYTNSMRDECLVNMYVYCMQKGINFTFYNLEDTEFFQRFYDGIPIYDEVKRIENNYAFVHFDGPHDLEPLQTEVRFFDARASNGAMFVFDDVSYYDHSIIDTELHRKGWVNRMRTPAKWSYQKEK